MAGEVQIRPLPALAGAPITVTLERAQAKDQTEFVVAGSPTGPFTVPLTPVGEVSTGQFIVQAPGNYQIKGVGFEKDFAVGPRSDVSFFTELGLLVSSVLIVLIFIISRFSKRRTS